MALPEVKNSTHKLIDLAAEWNCSLEDLFNFAERGLLQICQQRIPDVPNLFSSESEEEKVTPFLYENEPLEINNFKARELHKRYQDLDEPFILVITDIEKTRFEKENDLIKGNDQDELSTPSPPDQEKYPGEPGEMSLVGWRAICKPFGLKVGKDGKKPKSMNQHTEKENFPLMRMPGKKQRPYIYLSQINKYLASFQKK